MKLKLSHAQIMTLTRTMAERLTEAKRKRSTSDRPHVAVYPVPRGGVPVAYALQAVNNCIGIAEEPQHADVLVDDIIDSGSTRIAWLKQYPDLPFAALIDKSDKSSPYRDEWVVFPWEHTAENSTDETIVGTLTNRIRAAGGRFFANDNISQYLAAGDLQALEAEVADRVNHLLHGLVIDVDNDHNTASTAKRVAKMYLHEVFRGRYAPPPPTTDFPNVEKLDEMYVTGPITIRSGCSHHFVPIIGLCWIGIIPGERLIGLSKFNRIVDWVASRPQIQEELAVQIANHLEQQIKPLGIAVVIEATHMCMTWRGVREPMQAKMTNSVMRGAFRENPAAKAEFMALVKR